MTFILAFVTWAVLHSLMATLSFKEITKSVIGVRFYDGFYRLAYNIFATITFLPVFLLLAAGLPNRVLWSIPKPLNYLFLFIQMIGAIGLVISLWQTDLSRFAGLSQAVRFLLGTEPINPKPRLVLEGTYAYVRHPLYFFSLLLLWFWPTLTVRTLIFNILATLYFWVGSIYEERRLIATFGKDYLEYKQRVPRLFPIKLTP